jgi:hypothetical protein
MKNGNFIICLRAQSPSRRGCVTHATTVDVSDARMNVNFMLCNYVLLSAKYLQMSGFTPSKGGCCNLFVVFSSEQSHTRVYFSLWLRYDMEFKAFHLTRIYPALAGVTNGEN